MASTIKIKNSSTAGAIPTSSDLVQGELAVNVTDKTIFTENASGTVVELGKNYTGFKNRIINGAMMIDQRNAGASVTLTSNATYTLDRWGTRLSQASKFSVQQTTTAPTGFYNSLKVTSASAYTVGASEFFGVYQNIEGFNISDLAWGTASAATVTLSFQVYSSLTGTFGGSLFNASGSQCYPFSYSVPVANTWTTITLTVTGPTSGSWNTGTNLTGISVFFSLGSGATVSGTAGVWSGTLYRSATGATSVVGTSGATFYITGVQLEKGSTATSFDYRPYGTELALCQRYYYKTEGSSAAGSRITQAGYAVSTTGARVSNVFPVPMRTTPSALEQSGTAGQYSITGFGNIRVTCSAVPTFSDAQTNHATTNFTVASGLTAWSAGQGAAESTTTPSATVAYLAWSAEL